LINTIILHILKNKELSKIILITFKNLFNFNLKIFKFNQDLAQKWSKWVVKNIYTPDADGLPGNDDYGTMSAWLAFVSMGFYPRAGCP
jgi:putative alpha-1,2-mannosidase